MTEDNRSPAARRYETEEAELDRILRDWALAERDGEEGPETEAARLWLDRTLYTHREQAYAEGLQSWGRPTGWKGWWDQNWFGVALLAMIGFGLLAIGFVNGWS